LETTGIRPSDVEIDEIQAYLSSRPLSVEALEELLRHPERISYVAGSPSVLPAAAVG
jgi:hypothetical protein